MVVVVGEARVKAVAFVEIVTVNEAPVVERKAAAVGAVGVAVVVRKVVAAAAVAAVVVTL